MNEEKTEYGMNSGAKTKHRKLRHIAADIKNDWQNINYAAKPYLDAMRTLDNVSQNYICDRGDTIICYFLSNAGTWKGETAKKIKQELKNIIGLK